VLQVLYTLSFTHRFEHSADVAYFAYCYPYTYSDLRRDLATLAANPARQRCCERTLLCKTLAGNDCDLLTITSPGASALGGAGWMEDCLDDDDDAPVSRVHHGLDSRKLALP
jgi:hypothetical protein